jgi:hypothetical protein
VLELSEIIGSDAKLVGELVRDVNGLSIWLPLGMLQCIPFLIL